jgi:hypothetical protein
LTSEKIILEKEKRKEKGREGRERENKNREKKNRGRSSPADVFVYLFGIRPLYDDDAGRNTQYYYRHHTTVLGWFNNKIGRTTIYGQLTHMSLFYFRSLVVHQL